MSIYDSFKVNVSETGEIINLNELLSVLENVNITDELDIYLTNLQNRINNSDYTNKDVLVTAINARLLKYKAHNKALNNSNIESLKLMQSINPDTKRISILSNNSNKDIDYLTFTNEVGKVEVIGCHQYNILNEYIKIYSDVIASSSASDIIKHIKEYTHQELQFVVINNPNYSNLQTEELINQEEYEEVKKYVDKYSLSGEIEVAITLNNERLYRVNDGLFRFKTEGSIKTIEVLQTPSIEQNATNELTSTVNQSAATISLHNTTEDYNSLPTWELTNDLINQVIALLQKRDIYGEKLSNSEVRTINITIKSLIRTMQARVKTPNAQEEKLLKEYIEPLIAKYNRIKIGLTNPSELSDIEISMCEEYMQNQEYTDNNNLNQNNNKKLELSNSNHNYENGMATAVMLLEIMLITLLIILFSYLDI